MALLELESIRKDYDLEGQVIRAVDGVSLNIEKGEFISIVGHSGSGKTTLLSIMGGILAPTGGAMRFKGTDIYTLDDDGQSEYRALSVGYIFQFSSLMPVLNTLENLLLPVVFKPGQSVGRVHEKKAMEYLDLVGLADKAHAFPYQLSGGQQRRVAIARAFMNEPEFLLADEPTGDLDEETEADVMGFLKKLHQEKGHAMVLVTHNSELAGHAAKRIRMTHGHVENIT
jgi:putative ABC transport system ATP-binding protein/lipoprotein-releasing system ATP-binding protein